MQSNNDRDESHLTISKGERETLDMLYRYAMHILDRIEKDVEDRNRYAPTSPHHERYDGLWKDYGYACSLMVGILMRHPPSYVLTVKDGVYTSMECVPQWTPPS